MPQGGAEMRTWIIIGLGLAMLLGGGMVLWASQYHEVKCSNAGCGFRQEIEVGPTMTQDVVAGYCVNCAQFVEIRWQYEPTVKDAPTPLGTVWNPETGKTAAIYACPVCKGPFQAIDREQLRDMSYCPQCSKETLEVNGTGEYSD
jgi:hypothetical protein